MPNSNKTKFKKSHLAFLGFTSFSTLFSPQVVAQNKLDDIAIVDRMLEQRTIDLISELDLQLRVLKERYSAAVVAMQTGKIKYIAGQKSSARRAFSSVPQSDEEFQEMVFTFYRYASMKLPDIDRRGQAEAAALLIENGLLAKSKNDQKDMVNIYYRSNRSDKAKLALLKEYCAEQNLSLPGDSIDEFIVRNDAAEKIILKDFGVPAGATLNINDLEEIVKAVKEMEWNNQDYKYYRCVNEMARAMIFLGKTDDALSLLKNKAKNFKMMNALVAKNIQKENSALPRKQRLSKKEMAQRLGAVSLSSGSRYAKGIAYLLKAKRVKGSDDKKAKQYWGIAATNFYLCALKHKGTQEAFKSIIRYDACRDLAKEWFGKEPKPLPISKMDAGKAFYSVGNYARAIESFRDYMEKPASSTGYEAIYFAVISTALNKDYDAIDKYLDKLKSTYADMESADNSKEYFKKSCKYMAGVFLKLKRDADSEVEKADFQAKQVKYVELSNSLNSTADVSYKLASGKYNRVMQMIKADKRDSATADYKQAVSAFESLIKNFPSSTDALRSFEKLARLHSSFEEYSKAAEAYEEYYKRASTADLTGRIKKASVIMAVADIYFKQKAFDKALAALADLETFMAKEDLSSDDPDKKRTVALIKENSSLVSILTADKQLQSKRKELSALKNEIKQNANDASLRDRLSKAEGENEKHSLKLVRRLKGWLEEFPDSTKQPSIMAFLGGIYQQLDNVDEANVVYSELKERYPDHKVVKQIVQNIVRLHLDREDMAAAAASLSEISYEKQDDLTLEYFAQKFKLEELAVDELGEETFMECMKVLVKSTSELNKRLIASNAKINRIHQNAFRFAYATFNLNKLSEASTILAKIAKEKPYGPYIFKVGYLQGAICAKQKEYSKAKKIFFGLLGLNARMPKRDWGREVVIQVELSAALSEATDKKLQLTGYGNARAATKTNIDGFGEDVKAQVERSYYLAISYAYKLGKKQEAVAMKDEFRKKFPTSPYSKRVRNLK
ncbi:MAG: tetratricopeptide repeat protein [Lentisphaeraceae bacterium]|nr:tetratricopeptide repeat protein [Lentisphaeraceae bacterium]